MRDHAWIDRAITMKTDLAERALALLPPEQREALKKAATKAARELGDAMIGIGRKLQGEAPEPAARGATKVDIE